MILRWCHTVVIYSTSLFTKFKCGKLESVSMNTTEIVEDTILANGRYPKDLIIGKWGDDHNVPHKCYQLIKSRKNIPCQTLPTWYYNGTWTCGRHKPFANKELSSEYVLPPPLNPPQFESFDCSICMETCASEKISYTYSCNHKFHKACVENWAKEKDGTLTCPMCRDKQVSHPFYKAQWEGYMKRYPTFQMNTVYTRIIHRYKVTIDEWELSMEILKLLLNNLEDLSANMLNKRIKDMVEEFPTKDRRIDFKRRMHQLQLDVMSTLSNTGDVIPL